MVSGALKAKQRSFNGFLIGVTVPIGAGLIRASYSEVKHKNINAVSV